LSETNLCRQWPQMASIACLPNATRAEAMRISSKKFRIELQRCACRRARIWDLTTQISGNTSENSLLYLSLCLKKKHAFSISLELQSHAVGRQAFHTSPLARIEPTYNLELERVREATISLLVNCFQLAGIASRCVYVKGNFSISSTSTEPRVVVEGRP
jgi:hypothetical protein